MALATTCPQCKTSFRVVPDQLKLRRGFVRCGRCRHVFAGIEHLRYLDDAQRRSAAPPSSAEAAVEAGHERIDERAVERADARGDEREVGPRDTDEPTFLDPASAADIDADLSRPIEPREEEPVESGRIEPAGREGREDQSAGGSENDCTDADAPIDEDVEWVVVGTPDFESLAEDPLTGDARGSRHATLGDEARREASSDGAAPTPPPYLERFGAFPVDDAHNRRTAGAPPATDADSTDAGDDGEAAIDYFSTKRSRGFADRRGIAFGFAALVLAIALTVQWIVAQRSTIGSRLPAVAPLLDAALSPFGLRIEAPRELDALTIESFELQASQVPDVLEMRALLRNRADHPVRWPSMQLTLTDPASRVLVSRTLDPDDYLDEAGAQRREGVPAQTEWPLRLALEASDLQLAGYDYRVRLFYP
ncbi:MAG TPA: DUF3426 domain-containing protein [Zeimonas sp.]